MSNPIAAAGLLLDMQSNRLSRSSGEEQVHLSAQQAEILSVLMRHAGSAVTYDHMTQALYGSAGGPLRADNLLKVQIHRLRAILAKLGVEDAIVNVWGIGYMLRGRKSITTLAFDPEQMAAYNRVLESHMRVSPADVALLRRRA
jgi:DNA-binding response OmpR family regulator